MVDRDISRPVDIPVDPLTGPASIVPKPETEKRRETLEGPLGETTAEPYENEG